MEWYSADVNLTRSSRGYNTVSKYVLSRVAAMLSLNPDGVLWIIPRALHAYRLLSPHPTWAISYRTVGFGFSLVSFLCVKLPKLLIHVNENADRLLDTSSREKTSLKRRKRW